MYHKRFLAYQMGYIVHCHDKQFWNQKINVNRDEGNDVQKVILYYCVYVAK